MMMIIIMIFGTLKTAVLQCSERGPCNADQCNTQKVRVEWRQENKSLVVD